jgi:hypothetical protein
MHKQNVYIEDLDIFETWQGLRAISPAKVLRLVERKDAEIDRLNRQLIDIGLGRNPDFGPRASAETSVALKTKVRQTFERKCARCGLMAESYTPEGVGIFYCSHECAD